MNIYGAGLAGLLAACHFQRATVFEKNKVDEVNHKALLRFRTAAVGESVGIDFRKVRVHKGIYYNGKFVPPSILMANMYSKKVIGRLADRSIWNLDPVDRYIAPENFIEQLIDRCGDRIKWDTPVDISTVLRHRKTAISTLPLSLYFDQMLEWYAVDHQSIEFTYAPIEVRRWRVKNADVHQTIYFPDQFTSVYRASMTGDILIAEYVPGIASNNPYDTTPFQEFGLYSGDCEPLGVSSQQFGKIVSINDEWRKRFIFRLSQEYKIYSLGRFGTWRNILLDDVLHDINVIKRLMNTSSYEQAKEFTK